MVYHQPTPQLNKWSRAQGPIPLGSYPNIRNLVGFSLGYLKGKSAIHIARTFGGKRRNFVGQHFWARGYWVSTVGHNEAAVRKYIQDQEKEDQRLDQLGLFENQSRFERLQD